MAIETWWDERHSRIWIAYLSGLSLLASKLKIKKTIFVLTFR